MSILSRLRRSAETAAAVPDPVAIIRRKEIEEIRQASVLPEMDEDGNDPMSRTVYARIIPYSDGYGYEICVGEVPAISQRYHPETSGNAPMTEIEAKAMAEKALSKYGVI